MKNIKIRKDYVNLINYILTNKLKIREVEISDNGVSLEYFVYLNGTDRDGFSKLGRRANGLCYSFLDGYSFLYLKNGKLHREDGPAMISMFCSEWHLNGVHIKELNNKSKCDERKLNLLHLKYCT